MSSVHLVLYFVINKSMMVVRVTILHLFLLYLCYLASVYWVTPLLR